MSLQIKKKFIEDGAVDESKILLSNDANLEARNAADNGNVPILKINGSDEIEFGSLPVFDGENLATEGYVDTAVGALAGAFIYKGTWDADQNDPALSNGTGTVGHLYRVSVAGTVDFGAGDIEFQVGDKAVYRDGVWEKWDVIDNEFATSDTDDLAEGAANLYFTEARAKAAAVVDSTAGNETDQAASVAAMKLYVEGEVANAGSELQHESFTLDGTDITNGYVQLAGEPIASSVIVSVVGSAGLARNGADFTIENDDELTFDGALSALLDAGDILEVYYQV